MKSYTVTFGSGDPRGFTGLSPTFLLFWNLSTGTTNAPPSIAELVTGKTGIYSFNYGVTQPIAFLLDAATTSPGANGRYVTGQIDPADRADEYGNTLSAYGLTAIALGVTNVAIGTTLTALGNTSVALGFSNIAFTLIGSPTSSIGSTLSDPTTLFGFLMRAQEVSEGNQSYTKATGVWQMQSRGATLLRQKTITDTSSTTTRT